MPPLPIHAAFAEGIAGYLITSLQGALGLGPEVATEVLNGVEEVQTISKKLQIGLQLLRRAESAAKGRGFGAVRAARSSSGPQCAGQRTLAGQNRQCGPRSNRGEGERASAQAA